MPLEQVIRPLAQANISPAKATVTPRATNQPGTVTLYFGSRGSIKTMKITTSATASAYDVKKPTEKSI